MTRPVSENKHEQRRLATRAALRQAGVERFARDGYDATSIRDIATDAGVTERTFYRHFPTKEALLFHDYEHRIDFFRAALALRPDHEPILQAVLIAVEAYPDDLEAVRQAALLRTSALSAQQLERYMRFIHDAFAEEIHAFALRHFADRPDVDQLAAVAANAIAGALVASFETWGETGATDDMRARTHRGLTYLAEGFGEPAPRPVTATPALVESAPVEAP
jgi:AcrR family transcriptional regulator